VSGTFIEFLLYVFLLDIPIMSQVTTDEDKRYKE